MIEKQFKNLEEQIEIMKYKGLTINDPDFTKQILLRENYFFLNGYRYPLMKSMKDKRFLEGATFEELYSIFLFDRGIRNVFFKNLLIIENNLKSIFSYQLSKRYGYREKDYLKAKNFTQDKTKSRQVNDLIHKMKRQIRVNGREHTATSHYMMNYGYIPLWILVKVLSFGIVGELFSILKYEDQKRICDIYHLNVSTMTTYLPILSNYRNLCAHEDIVYEHRSENTILDTPYHEKLEIPRMDDDYIYGKNDIFAVLIICKYLLRKDDFRMMMREVEYEIEKLDGAVDSIPINKILDRMGIPTNYMDLVNM